MGGTTSQPVGDIAPPVSAPSSATHLAPASGKKPTTAPSSLESPVPPQTPLPNPPPASKGSMSAAPAAPVARTINDPGLAKVLQAHTTDGLAPVRVHTRAEQDMLHYTRLRDDLFAFSLGEAAFQYAERLNKESPDNPAVMALLSETAFLYEKTKNKGRREHWVDRLDVLQRGIDVSRKCMHDNPDYGPCYRTYILCASKMADNEVWFKRGKPLSLFKHYNRLQAIGDRALELYPSPDVALNLASVAGRCATRLRHWYSPWHPVARWYQLPYQRDLLLRSEKLMRHCVEMQPNNVEMACRLAEVLFELGELNESRRWYVRVRDEMQPDDPKENIWQTIAHTHLCSHFDRPSWNVPFG